MCVGRDLIEYIKNHPDDEIGQKVVDVDAGRDTVLVKIVLYQCRKIKRGSHHDGNSQYKKNIGFESAQYFTAGSIENVIDDIIVVLKKKYRSKDDIENTDIAQFVGIFHKCIEIVHDLFGVCRQKIGEDKVSDLFMYRIKHRHSGKKP